MACTLTFFKKTGHYQPLFAVYFRPFNMSQFKLIQVWMECLGFEPGAAEWKAKTNTLTYGGTPYVPLLWKGIIFVRLI